MQLVLAFALPPVVIPEPIPLPPIPPIGYLFRTEDEPELLCRVTGIEGEMILSVGADGSLGAIHRLEWSEGWVIPFERLRSRAEIRRFWKEEPVNLFDAPCDILVVPSNGVGATGKGIALQCAQRFPQTTSPYQEACRQGKQRPGQLVFVKADARQVCFFPTKRHWRDASRLEDVLLGLDRLAAVMALRPELTVAMPRIGCGLGGLDWAVVEPAIRARLPMARVTLV